MLRKDLADLSSRKLLSGLTLFYQYILEALLRRAVSRPQHSVWKATVLPTNCGIFDLSQLWSDSTYAALIGFAVFSMLVLKVTHRPSHLNVALFCKSKLVLRTPWAVFILGSCWSSGPYSLSRNLRTHFICIEICSFCTPFVVCFLTRLQTVQMLFVCQRQWWRMTAENVTHPFTNYLMFLFSF